MIIFEEWFVEVKFIFCDFKLVSSGICTIFVSLILARYRNIYGTVYYVYVFLLCAKMVNYVLLKWYFTSSTLIQPIVDCTPLKEEAPRLRLIKRLNPIGTKTPKYLFSILSSNWQHKFLYFYYKSVKCVVLCRQNMNIWPSFPI